MCTRARARVPTQCVLYSDTLVRRYFKARIFSEADSNFIFGSEWKTLLEKSKTFVKRLIKRDRSEATGEGPDAGVEVGVFSHIGDLCKENLTEIRSALLQFVAKSNEILRRIQKARTSPSNGMATEAKMKLAQQECGSIDLGYGIHP